MENFDKVFTNHKIEKKKKREKKKHWEYLYLVLPGTNISLDQSSIYTGTKLQTLWVCL